MVPDPRLAGQVRGPRDRAGVRDGNRGRRQGAGQTARSAALGHPGNRGAVMAQASPAVPLLDLQAQYKPLRAELLAAIERVCDSQRFIMGPEVEALERELSQHLEVEHAIAVSSGTDAILACLMALGIGPGDEVITSTYSF